MVHKNVRPHKLTDCFHTDYRVPKVGRFITCAVCAVTCKSRLEILQHLSTHEENDLYEKGFNKEMVIMQAEDLEKRTKDRKDFSN
jgi:hypothetical protein